MFQRFMMCSTLILLAWLPFPARAQDPVPAKTQEKEVPLTVRVEIRSLDTLIDNIKLLVSLAGREEIANQVDELIKTKVGPKGLEGIDPKRPIGFYSRFGSKELNHADVNGVVLVPIADENAFLNLLANLNFKAEKDAKTGIYTVKTTKDGFTPNVLFRFAHKYAYITALNVESIETKNLLAPAQVFSAKHASAISASLRIDQIPKELKDVFMTQLEQSIQNESKKAPPNENPVKKATRLETERVLTEAIFSAVKEGKQIGIDIDVDKASKEMSFVLSLSAQGNTELAKRIAAVGQTKSPFTGLKGKNSALHVSASLTLPPKLKDTFAAGIAKAQKELLDGMKDAEKRKQAETLLKAFAPTFEAGELNTALTLQGPDKDNHYSAVAAVKVRDGEKLSKTMHKLLEETIKDMPAQVRDDIKLDFETVHGTTIHRFNVGKHFPDEAKNILGDGPVYLAFRDDAQFFVVGPEGLAILKAALADNKEVAAPAFAVEVSLARLMPLLPKDARKKPAWNPDRDPGTIRFIVEGGDSLRIRLSTQLSVVQFIGVLLESRGPRP